MKTAGKISILALSCAFVLALAACGQQGGGSGGSSGGGASEPTATTTDTGTGTGGTGINTGGDTGTGTSDTGTSGTGTSTSSAGSPSGTITGNDYTNEYFGVSYKAPSGFTVATSSEAESAAASTPGVTFEYAASASTGDNVNANFEDMTVTGSAGLSEEEYVQAANELISATLASAGVDLKSSSVGTFSYNNVKHPMLTLELDIAGTPAIEKVICVKNGDYIFSITFTALNEKSMDTMLEGLTLTK